MTISEYAGITANLFPVKAQFMTIDTKYIRVFTKRPQLEGHLGQFLLWQGDCVAAMRYWEGFIDIAELKDEDGIDWYTGITEIKNDGWARAVALDTWIKLLDVVVPYEFEYATLGDGLVKLWKRKPNWNGNVWIDGGGRKPLAVFSAPSNLIKTASGFTEGPQACVQLSL